MNQHIHCVQTPAEERSEQSYTLWRFSFEEAFFLVHVLKAITVYVEEPNGLRSLSSEVCSTCTLYLANLSFHPFRMQGVHHS